MSDDSFELTLDAMAHGGAALGKREGRVVFVPYTIPGERIHARLTAEKGRVAFAEGVKLLEASADRVFPACPHFGPGKCGRCHWQHIDYQAQLLLKQDVLADQLARIGGFDEIVVQPTIPAPQQWGYNHHMTLSAQEGLLGFASADDGERLFPIEECHLLHPDLLDLYGALDLEFEGLQRMKLQIGTDGAHMLILSFADDKAPELHTDLPTSINMLLNDNEPVNLIGESHLRYQIAGQLFRVTAGSSLRANVAQLETLADVVVSALALRGDENILDLYAGVGFFTAFIAPRAGLVTLVESYPPAVTDADSNLADFENVDVIEGAAEDALPALEDSYHAALLDPPSSGLSTTIVDQLVEARISRLVYVSSDPATLARDAKRLVRHGYHLNSVQPIDLAPQTYFVDSIADFTWSTVGPR